MRSGQIGQQSFCSYEIGCLKTLGEAVKCRPEHFASGLALASAG
jgi:hypothetical protein